MNLHSPFITAAVISSFFTFTLLAYGNGENQNTSHNCRNSLDGRHSNADFVVWIEITPREGKISRFSTGSYSMTKITLFHVGDQTGSLSALGPLDIPNNASLRLFENIENKRRYINLSSEMNSRILDYLRKGGPPMAPFDCNCFAHYLNGYEYEYGWFYQNEWVIKELDGEEFLTEGNTIIIGHDRENITHFAIYLGNGLYLSKFGSSGPLIVTDLLSMKKSFSGNLMYKIVPIPEFTFKKHL